MYSISPRTWTTRRISRCRCMATSADSIGMKSCTSPTPCSVKKRVMRMLVSGK